MKKTGKPEKACRADCFRTGDAGKCGKKQHSMKQHPSVFCGLPFSCLNERLLHDPVFGKRIAERPVADSAQPVFV